MYVRYLSLLLPLVTRLFPGETWDLEDDRNRACNKKHIQFAVEGS